MRLGVIPESPIERLVARLNGAPQPLFETQIAFTLGRLVMVAAKIGVFEALASGPAPAAAVAERCGTEPEATGKLLFALAGAGYLRASGDAYELTPMSRKWLLQDSPDSLVDKLLFQLTEWEWVEHTEDYVRSGAPLEIHETIGTADWEIYQRGMRSIAGIAAAEVAARMPVPKDARDLLDIGGSHGYYSVELCRRHDELRAVVLDLPQAIEHAAPLLAAEGMGDRVVHRAGDALSDELGSDAYDAVLIGQLVHHFSEEENRELATRVARALRPGGVYAILDFFRSSEPRLAGQVPALFQFYFALTSRSGTWSPEEMASWQEQAGLRPRRPIRLRRGPGVGIQAATKTSG
ncbi:MAG TPA: class I SAM-dependent methyltransferase [Solirubrobacterales bacterium]|nr:class I SAM-dependent methyltransferase [Solirubrobacterales bacterium]